MQTASIRVQYNADAKTNKKTAKSVHVSRVVLPVISEVLPVLTI